MRGSGQPQRWLGGKCSMRIKGRENRWTKAPRQQKGRGEKRLCSSSSRRASIEGRMVSYGRLRNGKQLVQSKALFASRSTVWSLGDKGSKEVGSSRMARVMSHSMCFIRVVVVLKVLRSKSYRSSCTCTNNSEGD